MSIVLDSRKVIEESGVTFGTSGARGLVTQFNPNVCGAFCASFISSMKSTFAFNEVAIAIDNRPSSYLMAQACASLMSQVNIKVSYYGVVPTPALAYIASKDVVPAIMITGSHIPFDRNGIKFYRPDGEISKEDENTILNEPVEFNSIDNLPELNYSSRAEDEYILRYTSLFTSDWLVNKRVGIYEHSSSGRDIYHKIFKSLGAEVIRLGRSDIFVPIDTEAVSEEDSFKAVTWISKYNLDLMFSTDGDGDRPLVSDENGVWLKGDILGLLVSIQLGIEALAVPVSCNTAIESCGFFPHITRTRIGSPFVIDEFSNLCLTYESVAGFEANGGFLLGSDIDINGKTLKALPTRDAMLPVLVLLMASDKSSISELVRNLPKRYTHSDRIQNFEIKNSKDILQKGLDNPQLLIEMLGVSDGVVSKVDVTDGLRLSLSNGRVVHLRPSGNAPELRCYSESEDCELSKALVDNAILNILKNTQKN